MYTMGAELAHYTKKRSVILGFHVDIDFLSGLIMHNILRIVGSKFICTNVKAQRIYIGLMAIWLMTPIVHTHV